jgi:hypothetical protein
VATAGWFDALSEVEFTPGRTDSKSIRLTTHTLAVLPVAKARTGRNARHLEWVGNGEKIYPFLAMFLINAGVDAERYTGGVAEFDHQHAFQWRVGHALSAERQ